jgi:hypothetical protein
MFARRIKITIPFFLLGLALGIIFLTRHSSMLAEQAAPPVPPKNSIADTSEKGAEDKEATRPIEWAPFGFVYDFGKVPRGTPCKHSFRIVNTSGVPIRIISFRRAS